MYALCAAALSFSPDGEEELRRDAMEDLALRGFIGVLADDAVSLRNIEKLGFRHWASGWARYRFGHVTRWTTYDTDRNGQCGLRASD